MKWLDKLLFPLALALVLSIMGIAVRIAAPVTPASAQAGTTLPIVMYHHILKDSSRHGDYTISPDALRTDLDYLKQEGYTPIVVADLIAYTQDQATLPEKPIMITFDDGYESFHEYAFPILKEYGYKSVFSVVGALADQYSTIDDHHILYSHCTWNQLALLHESGLVEIQNHSYDLHHNDGARHGSKMKAGEHPEQYRQMLSDDLTRMQETCAEQLDGHRPTAFTYPFGQISPQTLPILKQLGFQAALTCEEKLNRITGDPEELYHLRRFNRPDGKSLQQILESVIR